MARTERKERLRENAVIAGGETGFQNLVGKKGGEKATSSLLQQKKQAHRETGWGPENSKVKNRKKRSEAVISSAPLYVDMPRGGGGKEHGEKTIRTENLKTRRWKG